jgi:hypothetical protein
MAWIVGGAMLGGALLGSSASSDAADAQAGASQYAADLQNKQYEQNRADMAPWREAGMGALDQLKTGLLPGGDFQRPFTVADFIKDPGYNFRRSEGMKGLEGSAASRGGLLSGGTLKALTRYGSDYASNEFGNAYNRYNNDLTSRFNRLSSLAGTSQTATRDVANMGMQNANNLGDLAVQAGNARASGYVGSANAINGGIQSIGNFYQNQQMMGRMFPNSAGGGNAGMSYMFPGGASDVVPMGDYIAP